MPRKNPMARLGRPPSATRVARAGAPMTGFDPAIPAGAFKCGGPVAHHDDSRMAKAHGEHGFASARQHFGRKGK